MMPPLKHGHTTHTSKSTKSNHIYSINRGTSYYALPKIRDNDRVKNESANALSFTEGNEHKVCLDDRQLMKEILP